MKLKHSFLIACLGAAPLCAQQVEQKVETSKAEKSESASGEARASATASANNNGTVKTETRSSDSRSNRRQPQPNQPNQPPPGPDQKPVAYIGVLTREVPSELRSQFTLPEGFGLMVDEVMPDSPAEQAGLKVHDLLLKFEDQQLVSMEQLMLLVRAKKKGDTVNLTVISGGKESQVSVTLGEKLMPVMQQRQQHGFSGWPQNGMPMFQGGDFRGFQNQGKELGEQMERFQQEMRAYQQRIQDWSKAGGNTPMPQPPMFNMPGGHQPRGNQPQPNPAGGNVQQFNFSESHTAANITRRDDSGEYTLKREDGKTTFIARPNNGQEQSWPVNDDTERKAVPEEFRDKLRMMDGANGNIRIEVHPGPNGPQGGPGAPVPPNGGNPPPPRAKGRATSA